MTEVEVRRAFSGGGYDFEGMPIPVRSFGFEEIPTLELR